MIDLINISETVGSSMGEQHMFRNAEEGSKREDSEERFRVGASGA